MPDRRTNEENGRVSLAVVPTYVCAKCGGTFYATRKKHVEGRVPEGAECRTFQLVGGKKWCSLCVSLRWPRRRIRGPSGYFLPVIRGGSREISVRRPDEDGQ